MNGVDLNNTAFTIHGSCCCCCYSALLIMILGLIYTEYISFDLASIFDLQYTKYPGLGSADSIINIVIF